MTLDRGRGLIADTRGAALIEFALTLPLVLVLIFGMADFGLAFQRRLTVANAAREGARIAVLQGYTADDVEARVAQYLEAAEIDGTPTTTATLGMVTPGSGPPFSAWTVTVELDHPFTFLGPIGQFVGSDFGTVTLRATAVMRTEIVAGGS